MSHNIGTVQTLTPAIEIGPVSGQPATMVNIWLHIRLKPQANVFFHLGLVTLRKPDVFPFQKCLLTNIL